MWVLWVKAVHIIAVVSWYAGLLYLPRLFVYHADCADRAGRARFAVMERRLYRQIMGPAMAVALLSGLAIAPQLYGAWLAVKLVLVAAVVAFHFSCGRYVGRLGENIAPGAKFFRFYNEVPAVLLVGIVVLAVIKPF